MHEPGQIHARTTGDIEDVIRKVMERRGCSRSQVARDALVWLGWIEDQRAEGRRVVSLKDGEGERELMWP